MHITLKPGESVTIDAVSATTPPIDPPVDPPVDPPTTEGQFLGDLAFDGARFVTQGVKGGKWCYARFSIPSGHDGRTANIS